MAPYNTNVASLAVQNAQADLNLLWANTHDVSSQNVSVVTVYIVSIRTDWPEQTV